MLSCSPVYPFIPLSLTILAPRVKLTQSNGSPHGHASPHRRPGSKYLYQEFSDTLWFWLSQVPLSRVLRHAVVLVEPGTSIKSSQTRCGFG
ncbi:hypothetical protein RRG08_057708 [Elysia crispata]|uniref:Uncharacterized protein n=1 Tax=Elysia crispata TaxID=231223 RepID=A0AAE0ZDL4_9GAST|nr:hypothetical protein RRG08_057708 [Elysia crispata]